MSALLIDYLTGKFIYDHLFGQHYFAYLFHLIRLDIIQITLK